ncbi:Methyl-CpG-binding domain protein 5 [Dissostichus eleginoides]|uniref:Methyl-CpG-binding domain protein 5 n=1 Tax=Dissostichus eleginoides TaxID=100907 RepID=A0AAD9FDK0_DISEL|nr:Methyl-CpG-binding domain protein 5 [Dissostichus eleginoides]
MMGGSETVSGDKDGVHTTAIHVPIGWQRRVDGGQVIYVSPSDTALCSLDEVKTYLLMDGTCKCGLECPIIIHKVFNFTVGVKVEQQSQPLGKAEQDMTKLCNHRRKVVAMAALCRSMQASQLPFANLHHPEMSSGLDSRDSKRVLLEREEDDHGIYHHPKLRPHSNLHMPPCASPKSSHHFIYPYNAYSAAQRSPRTPTPQGQRTPKTPETPGSPRLGPLSSPPPSSPMGGGGRGAQTHAYHPHGVIRSRHPSASPSPISDQGGGFTAAAAGGLMGSNLHQRRKSSSSSPHSPLPGGSPNPSPHFPKYKLEDILEQFKNSGNSSTNNHHLLIPTNSSLLTNQSSSNPNALSSKPSKTTLSPIQSAGPTGSAGSPDNPGLKGGGLEGGTATTVIKAASSVLFPPSHSLAQSLASSLPHLPLVAERNASHRKRQRRSPTVLSMLRDTQQLVNGPRRTPPGDSISATMAHLSRAPRQTEALDFTTGSTTTPLGLDPPTQPLSALLHLLSVQNAQASASAQAPEGGRHTLKQSPRRSPSSPAPHSKTPLREMEMGSNSLSTSEDLSHSQDSVSMAIPSSPKPLDLSNHVLALLAASSTAPPGEGSSPDHTTDVVMSSQGNPTAGTEESRCVDPKVTKPPAATSPGPPISSRLGDNPSPHTPSGVGDSTSHLPLAEAFPFMNQEQLLQLLSSTGGLPSLLDPAVLASLPLGGLWLGGQNAQIHPANATSQPPQTLAEQHHSEQQQLLMQHQETQDHHQKQQHMNTNPLFPLLPLLSGANGELPLNLLGLLNPLLPPGSTHTPGQDSDLGLSEKPSLQLC